MRPTWHNMQWSHQALPDFVLHTLSKFYDVPVGFEPPLILRLNIAYFTVAEGWLLLDIGWFVLFVTDLEQWHFVLKRPGCLSFIILNMCTKQEVTLIKMSFDILAERKCHPQVTGRLTFDRMTQDLTCVHPSFHLPFEYQFRSLCIEYIYSYCDYKLRFLNES